jgi:hypothetical protein
MKSGIESTGAVAKAVLRAMNDDAAESDHTKASFFNKAVRGDAIEA